MSRERRKEDPKGAAALLGVHESSVRRYARKGIVQHSRGAGGLFRAGPITVLLERDALAPSGWRLVKRRSSLRRGGR